MIYTYFYTLNAKLKEFSELKLIDISYFGIYFLSLNIQIAEFGIME